MRFTVFDLVCYNSITQILPFFKKKRKVVVFFVIRVRQWFFFFFLLANRSPSPLKFCDSAALLLLSSNSPIQRLLEKQKWQENFSSAATGNAYTSYFLFQIIFPFFSQSLFSLHRFDVRLFIRFDPCRSCFKMLNLLNLCDFYLFC